jgi:ribonuclease Z
VDLSVLFLGTAASVPTSQRGTAGFLVRRGGDRLLIDCGEGTQRQLLRSGVGLVDVDEILLTHYHADHFLGLPGMLKTFGLRGRQAPLAIYGPPGLRALVGSLEVVFGRLPYGLQLIELERGDWIGHDGYRVDTFATDHGVPSVGYAIIEEIRPGRFDLEEARRLGVPDGPMFGALQRGEPVSLDGGRRIDPAMVLGPARPGRRVVFSGDTRPCPAIVEAAAGADLLVHEATFLDEEAARARQTGHCTATQAGRIARDAQVSMLALTHLSTRHLVRDIRQEAEREFANTLVPRDFDVIDLPLPERGGPSLQRHGETGDPAAAEAVDLPVAE